MGLGTTSKANRARRGAVYGAGPARARQAGITIAPRLLPNLVRGRWLVITILVLIAAGVMVRLGIWQMNRLQGRIAANAAITRQITLPPLLLDAQVATTTDPETLTFRRVTVRGTWDYANEVELRYRSFDGQAGIHILTPLKLAGGDAVVIVDRGWIPYQEAGADGRRAYQQGDSAAIEGLVYESHAQSSASEEPGIFSQIDIPAIGAQLPYAVQPYWIQRLPSGNNVAPPRSEGLPDLSNGSHLGYMIQWWAFAATLLITYLVFANQTMLRDRRKKGEARAAGGAGGG